MSINFQICNYSIIGRICPHTDKQGVLSPVTTGYESVGESQKHLVKHQACKITDPLDEDSYNDRYKGMCDALYQNNLSANRLNASMKGETPKSGLINVFDNEMNDKKFFRKTSYTKGNKYMPYFLI